MEMEKNYLTKEMLNQVNDLPVMELNVEELNATVIIKTLSAAQITSLQDIDKVKANADEYFYKTVAMSLVDEQGNRLLSNADAKKVLGNWSMPVLMKIFNEIKKLNHIDETVEDKAKELKESPLLIS
jgi:hypothetical protein